MTTSFSAPPADAVRAANADEDAGRPMWGQRFGAAAELPLGAELYASAGNTSDLVAGAYTNRVFNGVTMALRATEMHEDAARESTKPVAPAILSPVFFSRPNRVFNGVTTALRATKMNEDAGAGHHETGSTGDLLSPVFFSRPNRVFRGAASSRSRGSALLLVLWLTAALSAIGLAVANNVRGETERTATNVDDVRAYFIARGAIQQAGLHVMWGSSYRNSDGNPIYHVPGDPSMNLSYPSAEVHVDVIPEASKLSLNGIRPEDLLRLLAALGVPESQANEITAAIIDWRTPPPPTESSPFDAYYLSLSPSFIPRHASFLENEELLLVKGITSDLYYGTSLDKSHPGLRDCLSVYASSGAVDINTAQLPTLEAIGLAPEDAATIVRSRAGHPILAGSELTAIAQSLGPAGSRLTIGGQTMYTLRATARMKGPDGKLSDLRRTVAALVKFNFTAAGSTAIGFEVLRWFDRA